jgi:hypothetical protein
MIVWVVQYYPPVKRYIREQINHALIKEAEIRYHFEGMDT